MNVSGPKIGRSSVEGRAWIMSQESPACYVILSLSPSLSDPTTLFLGRGVGCVRFPSVLTPLILFKLLEGIE